MPRQMRCIVFHRVGDGESVSRRGVMFLAGQAPRLIGWFLRLVDVWAGGRALAPWVGLAMALLDPFLVFAELLFQPMEDRVDRSHQIVRLIMRDEIVLVLGGQFGVNIRGIRVLQINRQLDRGDPIEDPQEFLGLGRDVLLGRIA